MDQGLVLYSTSSELFDFDGALGMGLLYERLAYTFLTYYIIQTSWYYSTRLAEIREYMDELKEELDSISIVSDEYNAQLDRLKKQPDHGLPFPILFFKYEPSPVDQHGNPISKIGTLLAIDQYGNIQTSEGPFGTMRRADWQGVVDSAGSPLPTTNNLPPPPSTSDSEEDTSSSSENQPPESSSSSSA